MLGYRWGKWSENKGSCNKSKISQSSFQVVQFIKIWEKILHPPVKDLRDLSSKLPFEKPMHPGYQADNIGKVVHLIKDIIK